MVWRLTGSVCISRHIWEYFCLDDIVVGDGRYLIVMLYNWNCLSLKLNIDCENRRSEQQEGEDTS